MPLWHLDSSSTTNDDARDVEAAMADSDEAGMATAAVSRSPSKAAAAAAAREDSLTKGTAGVDTAALESLMNSAAANGAEEEEEEARQPGDDDYMTKQQERAASGPDGIDQYELARTQVAKVAKTVVRGGGRVDGRGAAGAGAWTKRRCAKRSRVLTPASIRASSLPPTINHASCLISLCDVPATTTAA